MTKWMTIRTFSNRAEAEMVKTILENNGIVAVVQADDSGGMRPAATFAAGVRLQVEEKDLKKAKALVDKP